MNGTRSDFNEKLYLCTSLKSMKIMRINVVAVLTLFILFLGSCSVPKNVTYFQGVDDLTPEQKELMNQNYSSRICPDDR